MQRFCTRARTLTAQLGEGEDYRCQSGRGCQCHLRCGQCVLPSAPSGYWVVPVTALSNCRRDTWPFLLFGKPPPRDVGLRQPHSFLVAECSKAQWGSSSPGPGCQVLHSRGEAASEAEGTWTPQGQGLGLTQSPAQSASVRTQEVCAQ